MSFNFKSNIKLLTLLFFLVGVSVFYVWTTLPSKKYEIIKEVKNLGEFVSAKYDNGQEIPKYYFTKNKSLKPKISASSYVVGDLNTGKIILAKDQNKIFPLASVSKLMTALVSKDTASPDAITQISKKALSTEGENGNLHLNEKIKIDDLLYPLLLESSNDAAEAIAEYSKRDLFIEKMNSKAKDLGLASTFFEDPSGLSPLNQSTAFDLFQLIKYLKNENPNLLEITTKKSHSNKKHIWFNNNQLLHNREYEGGKSGYIDEALQTGVAVFSVPLGEAGAHSVAIALLHSKDRYRDMENILKYLTKNIYYGTEENANTAWIKEGIIENGEKELNSVTLSFLGDIRFEMFYGC